MRHAIGNVIWWVRQLGSALSQFLAVVIAPFINPFLPNGSPLLGNADISLSMWSGVMISWGHNFWLSNLIYRVTEVFDRHHVFDAIELGEYKEQIRRKGGR